MIFGGSTSDKEVLWNTIVESIRKCRKCILHKSRTKPVPGEGNLNANILFIGEAPGRQEDLSGRPFVGQAGKLLETLLEGIGLRREDVFITNVVKCRPPNNRDPKEEEVMPCSEHTQAIIKLVSPKIIVTLGNHSGKYIFSIIGDKAWRGVSRMRGKIYELKVSGFGKVLAIPTYHPAAALYNPKVKPAIESDFGLIIKALKRLTEVKERGETRKTKSLLDFIQESKQ